MYIPTDSAAGNARSLVNLHIDATTKALRKLAVSISAVANVDVQVAMPVYSWDPPTCCGVEERSILNIVGFTYVHERQPD